jgi:hypothetical protein
MRNLEMAILESRWWETGNDSVKGMFDALSSIFCGNSSAYHYEMFASAESIKEIISRIARDNKRNRFKRPCRILYIASHGNEQVIAGPGDNKISRSILRKSLSENPFDGIYFGSCEFMNVDNAKFFYLESDYISPWWFAGFSRSVPWITSTVFDIMLFDIYFNLRSKHRDLSELELVRKVADLAKEKLGPLCEELGFDIYVMEAIRGPRGIIKNQRRKLFGLISGSSWQNF